LDSDRDFIEHYKELLHEIKSPLDIIEAHAGYLKKNACRDKKENDEYLSIIISETERLRTFLEEVSESIRQVTLCCSFKDINRIIRDVTSKLKFDFERKDVNVVLSLQDGLPDLFVDEHKLERVLINLINNAVDAVDIGGTVTISTDANELFYLKIKDDGSGIKRGDMKSIFDPFFTTRPEGSGLGLYITKKIIDAHGGSINVASEPGEGTEFLIILPIHREGD
jgi:signal transduction histidine kinase